MKAVIFDTETSGLLSTRLLPLDKQPEIIEFYGALVDLETGDIKKELHSFFKPLKAITDEITKITHIDNAMLENAPRLRDMRGEIREFLESAPMIIAHNASYDKEMVDVEFSRFEEEMIWPHVICTVEETIFIKGYRLSLTALHEYLFGEPFADSHRADVDTKALIRCCVELYKKGFI